MKIEKTIYLDHQATTPLDSQVFEAMQPYLAEQFGNPHATDHAIGWHARQAVESAAASVGAMIGADSDEVIFTSGATEANNLALLGLARRAAGERRKRILVGATEHKSVLSIARVLAKELGYVVSYLPVDPEGRVDLEALKGELDEDVLAVSVMAVNNEIGTVQDIPAVSRLARQAGTILHCDAAQAPCAIDLSDYAQFVDMISLSGHKMYGPMGVGALYIRRELQNAIEPLIYGGGQQNGLRSGTLPTPLCVGLGEAAELATGEKAKLARAEMRALRDNFVARLLALPHGIALNGPQDLADRHPGNANMRFAGVDAGDFLSRLQPMIAASTGSACTSGIPEPSHVLGAIGLSGEEASASVRFSLGKETALSDIEAATEVIASVLDDMEAEGFLESA